MVGLRRVFSLRGDLLGLGCVELKHDNSPEKSDTPDSVLLPRVPELGVGLQFLWFLECLVDLQFLNGDSGVGHRQFIQPMDGIPAAQITFGSVGRLQHVAEQA